MKKEEQNRRGGKERTKEKSHQNQNHKFTFGMRTDSATAIAAMQVSEAKSRFEI